MSRADDIAIVLTLVHEGESYYVEFKTCWEYGPDGRKSREIREVARDIGEAVVAFANSEGGDLVVGVEDSGTITGIPWDGDQLLYLSQAHQHVEGGEPGVRVFQVEIEGKAVLLFRVGEYAEAVLVTAGGRCLKRKGAASVPMAPKEIEAARSHRRGDAGYEMEPVKGANLGDLDLTEMQKDVMFVALRSPPLTSLMGRPERLLRYWNLIDQRNGHIVLRRAALLLFAKEPLRWHPNNKVRIRRVAGEDPGFGRSLRTREIQIAGPIIDILRTAPSRLLQSIEREAQEGDLFSVSELVPRDAIFETLVNAVAHRNYAIEGQAIEVLIHPDRVEVRSPGKLPEPITIEALRAQDGIHRSRNPVIMRVLRDLGWTRDQGEGMRRIFGSMRQMELHEPELEESFDTFVVRLSTQSVYDDATRSWIASYGPFGLAPDERKYLVQLRRAAGSLSVDKLARRMDQSYDATKEVLVGLERKRLVRQAKPKSRTYVLVEPLNVPHERAYKLLERAKIRPTRQTAVSRDDLSRLARVDDTSLDTMLTQWKELGVLRPAGRKKWRFGESFLEYVRGRS